MNPAEQEEGNLGPEFNLDAYRALLEQLQASKRKQEQIAKKFPSAQPPQS